jgi:dTMP kinase
MVQENQHNWNFRKMVRGLRPHRNLYQEPTDSIVGKLIRKMLKSQDAKDENFQRTLALLFAADRTLLMDHIRKEADMNRIVLSDRSFYSSLAYQNGEEWIAQINHYALEPDLVVLLDLETETALTDVMAQTASKRRISWTRYVKDTLNWRISTISWWLMPIMVLTKYTMI